MMKWLVFICVIAFPVQASQWICGHARAADPTHLDTIESRFELHIQRTGRFIATLLPHPNQTKLWTWSGTWTTFEGSIVMIGTARTKWRDPIIVGPGLENEEIQAHTILMEDDLLVLNMTRNGRTIPVQCLLEHD